MTAPHPPDLSAQRLPDAYARRLRVAVLNRNFDPTGGGAERYSIALVEQLAARHEIHVFAQTIRHQWPGVTYHRIPMPLRRPRWINQLWFAWATARATRSGFDIVHSHENTWQGQIQTIHVLPIRHNLFTGLSGGRWALRWLKVLTSPRLLAYLWLEQARYRTTPGRTLVVTSGSLGEVMASAHPSTRGLLRLVTPGVAAAPGRATDVAKARARQALGLPPDNPMLLLVANDYRKKGLPTLLAALAALPTAVHLAVVGNPVHADGFMATISALKLEGRVHFLGALADVTPAYEAADILAHPTLADTFAMAVLEAMAHGLPVVVSAAPYCGVSDLLSDGDNACLLRHPQDAEALTEALAGLLNNPAQAAAMGASAAAFASGHLWAQVAERQNGLYLEALKTH